MWVSIREPGARRPHDSKPFDGRAYPSGTRPSGPHDAVGTARGAFLLSRELRIDYHQPCTAEVPCVSSCSRLG